MSMYEFSDKEKWALQQYDELALKSGKNGTPNYSQASKIIGLSSAMLSAIKNNTYKGDYKKNLETLIDYFETKERQKDIEYRPKYVPTSVSSDCYEVISICQSLGRCVRITGDAGIGKTKSAIKYAEDHPNTCIMITANPIFAGTKAIMNRLGKNLNVANKDLADLYDNITNRLHDGRIIIIDEAQCLNANAINTLRSIPDYFESKGETLGLVFMGNHSLKTKLELKNNDEIYEQVGSRSRFKPEYYKSDLTVDDIALVIPQLKGCEKELNFLHKLMQLKGCSLRNVVDVWTFALNNGNVTYEGLKASAEGISRMNRKRNILED